MVPVRLEIHGQSNIISQLQIFKYFQKKKKKKMDLAMSGYTEAYILG